MIIVTGGAGFIGSNIVRALNERGRADILIVDDLGGDDKYKNLIGLRFADYQHKDDFLKETQRVDFGKNVEAIFHEGACSDTMEYNVPTTTIQRSCSRLALKSRCRLFMRRARRFTAWASAVFAKRRLAKVL